MNLDKVSLADTHSFSPFFIDYIQRKENLKPFYKRFPALENFAGQIEEKKSTFPKENRATLVEAIRRQYQGYDIPSMLERNIESLNSANTFTITTGHQLNIFTGPLYFIFKIITVINTCRKLKATYPEYNFVPVYWMASEDHDYEEIKYFKLHNKKYVWETEQQGAVGRFSTKGLDKLAAEVPGDTAVFQTAYTKHKKLADAARHYVNALFGDKGLLVIDADERILKAEFAHVMSQDIISQVNKPLVDKTNEGLEKLGYKTQIYCRDINFFYLDEGIRSRIENDNDQFRILDNDVVLSKAQINKIISEEPEKLSPNVILRPLYQEVILPNLAYVGGPAEVIYWLQLKTVFDHFKVPFPILMPRNFGMVIDHEIARKIGKTGLESRELFEEKNYLFNHWVLAHATHNITVGEERNAVSDLFKLLKDKAEKIDPTLGPFVGAESKRVMNSLEKIERKMLRAEKRLHTDKLRQIESVKDALFPNGSLQERSENFLTFYQRDPSFIDRLEKIFDPLDFSFNLLSYPERS